MKTQLSNLVFLNPIITSLEELGYKRKTITIDNEFMMNEVAPLFSGTTGYTTKTEKSIYFVDDNYQTIFELKPSLLFSSSKIRTVADVLVRNEFIFSKMICLEYSSYVTQGIYDATDELTSSETIESYNIIIYEFTKAILEKF